MTEILNQARGVLSTTVGRWQALSEALSAEFLARSPAAAEWSALQCLQHLIDAERLVFPVRVQAILAGQEFPAYDPDSQGTTAAAGQSPADLVAEFGRLRNSGLATLNKVKPEDLAQQARHAELGLVTLGELIHEWAGHDLMHTVQAERALMQPFIRGCGPWHVYFSDHIIDDQTS